MTAKTRTIPAPGRNPESQPYWEAAQQGRLLVKKCTACKEFHFYPRSMCPFCHSNETEWVESTGKGVIYSVAVMWRAEIPYAMAFVTLDEGVSMMTNIVTDDFKALKIGQRVSVVWVPSEDGTPVPMFSPV